MSLTVNIRKDYGEFRLDVNFSTNGGILGLLGASGSGKSRTLNCIAGIDKPDSGRIELNGKVLFDSEHHIDLPPQKRRVGFLFQNYALFPNMTVRQNILCGMHGEKDHARKEEKLRRTVALLGLEGLENRRPYALSGGQQQRAALARILVSEPELLLLDEPFSALDSHLRERLQMELRGLLAEFGRDVLLVTHSRDEAYCLCENIAVLDAGRVAAHKPTAALFADPGCPAAAVLTGCKNIVPAQKCGEFAVQIPDWGICLQTGVPVRDGVQAVGIRAHAFYPAVPGGAPNAFAVEKCGEMAEPFERVFSFRFAGQSPAAQLVWWRMPTTDCPDVFPAALALNPMDVMLLY